MLIRVLFGVITLLLFFVLPWWVVLVLVLAQTFYFENFYEIIIISIFADVLYGSIDFIGFPYPITLISIICFYLIKKIKKNLSVY